MKRFLLCSAVVVLSSVLASCAHEEPLPSPDALPPEAGAIPPAGRFVLTGIRRPLVATVSETGIQGADVNLGRFPGANGTAWRGTSIGRDVNVTVSSDGATGIVSRSPFNLTVTPGPDGMQIQGLMGGGPSTVTVSKTRINGTFGRCGYDLRFQGQAYVGPRSCGGSPIQVGLTLPGILASWSDAEVATVLALLLSDTR